MRYLLGFAALIACCADDTPAMETDGSTATLDANTDVMPPGPDDVSKLCAAGASQPTVRPERPELRSDLTVELVPSGVAVFHYVDCAACESLAPKALLRNSGSVSLVVDRIVVTPDTLDVIASTELPRELAPNDTLPIELRFRGKVSSLGRLTVESNGMRSEFTLSAVAVSEGSLVTQNVYAWDFGSVAAGTLSSPLHVEFGYQRATMAPISRAQVPSVSAPFELTSPAKPLGILRSCSSQSIDVVLRAPPSSGRVEGLLNLEIEHTDPSTETSAGGSYVVYLYGTSVAK